MSLQGAITFKSGIFKGSPIFNDFGMIVGRNYIKFLGPPTLLWDGCDQNLTDFGGGSLCTDDANIGPSWDYEVYSDPDGVTLTGTGTCNVVFFASRQTNCCSPLPLTPCFVTDSPVNINAFIGAGRADCGEGGMRVRIQTVPTGPSGPFIAGWQIEGIDNTVDGCNGGTVTYPLQVGGFDEENPISSGPITMQMSPACSDCAGHPFENPSSTTPPARCGASMNFFIEIWDGTYDGIGNANYVIAMGVGLGTGGCGTWSFGDDDVRIDVQKYIGSSGDTDPDCCPPGDANDPAGPACNSNAAWQFTIVGVRIRGTALIRTACGFSCPPAIFEGDSPGTVLRDDIPRPDHGDTAGEPGWRNLQLSFNTDCPS